MGKRRQVPTFLLELPLMVSEGQAKHLRAHLEACRQFYNAVLSEGHRRMRQMRADPAQDGQRVPSLVPASRNARQLSHACGSSMASRNMPCIKRPLPCVRVG
jgi:hypothetical protein